MSNFWGTAFLAVPVLNGRCDQYLSKAQCAQSVCNEGCMVDRGFVWTNLAISLVLMYLLKLWNAQFSPWVVAPACWWVSSHNQCTLIILNLWLNTALSMCLHIADFHFLLRLSVCRPPNRINYLHHYETRHYIRLTMLTSSVIRMVWDHGSKSHSTEKWSRCNQNCYI